MSKIMIGQDGGSYTFNKVAKTITLKLPSGQLPTLEGLLVITDVTNNIIIYNFADPTKGGTISGNTLTLDHDTNTGSFNNADKLQIWYYDAVPQSVSIDDLTVMLRSLLSHTTKQTENSKGQMRVVIEDNAPVSVTNSINVAGLGSKLQEDTAYNPAQLSYNWEIKVRNKIT